MAGKFLARAIAAVALVLGALPNATAPLAVVAAGASLAVTLVALASPAAAQTIHYAPKTIEIVLPKATGVAAIDTPIAVAAFATNESTVWAQGGAEYAWSPDQIVMNDGQWLRGVGVGHEGRGVKSAGTRIRKAGNGTLINMSGTGVFVGRNGFMGITDLLLDGGDFTGPLIRMDHTDHVWFSRMGMYGNNGPGVVGYNPYDIYITDVFADHVYGNATTGPTQSPVEGAFNFYNVTEDSTNAVYMSNVRVENFKYGCIKIGAGGPRVPHSFYLTNIKCETSLATVHPFIDIAPEARSVHLTNAYMALVGFDPVTAPRNIEAFIQWRPHAASSIRNLTMYAGRGMAVWAPLSVALNAPRLGHTFDNIAWDGAIFPGSGGILQCSANGLDFAEVRNVRWTSSARRTSVFAGPCGDKLQGEFIPANDGPITDSFFPTTPRDGQYAIDKTSGRLYVRVGGVWKYAVLNFIVAPGIYRRRRPAKGGLPVLNTRSAPYEVNLKGRLNLFLRDRATEQSPNAMGERW